MSASCSGLGDHELGKEAVPARTALHEPHADDRRIPSGVLELGSFLTSIRAYARHHQANGLSGRAPRVDLADDRTLVHDEDSVREAEHLVQVLGDDQDGRPALPLFHQTLVDVLCRTYIDA